MGNKFLQTIWWAIWFGLSLTTVVMLIVAPEFNRFILGLFATSLTIFLSLLYINRSQVISFVQTKYFKNLLSNLTTIFLMFCIFGMVNYIVFKNNTYFDLTQQKVHTLSNQSKSILKDLKTPLKFTLYARRPNWERYLTLLNLYKFESEQVSVDVIDVDTNPSLVQLNNIKDEGTAVIEYQGKKVLVKASSELGITNMII